TVDASRTFSAALPRVGGRPPSASLAGVIWNLTGGAKVPIGNRYDVFAAWQTLRPRRAYGRSAPLARRIAAPAPPFPQVAIASQNRPRMLRVCDRARMMASR